MEERDVYVQLADHLSLLGMGYPPTEDLVEILRENFSPTEVEVALAIPTRVIPLQPVNVDEIIDRVNLNRTELIGVLDALSRRGLLFSSETEDGEKGYALQQVGFSFPQTFFWKGEDTAHARNMASLVAKYFNRKVTQ
jgi:predicted transcriptional regulator